MSEQKVVYSFAWYQPEEWELLKRTVDDPSTLDDTYAEWRHNAENSISEIRANGHTINKTSIKIDQLMAWCSAKGLKPDSSARSEYAAFLAQQRAEK
jgi:hypothetical protein